jgi:hypothetical protein
MDIDPKTLYRALLVNRERKSDLSLIHWGEGFAQLYGIIHTECARMRDEDSCTGAIPLKDLLRSSNLCRRTARSEFPLLRSSLCPDCKQFELLAFGAAPIKTWQINLRLSDLLDIAPGRVDFAHTCFESAQ